MTAWHPGFVRPWFNLFYSTYIPSHYIVVLCQLSVTCFWHQRRGNNMVHLIVKRSDFKVLNMSCGSKVKMWMTFPIFYWERTNIDFILFNHHRQTTETISNVPHSKELYSYQLIYHGFYVNFQVGVNTRQQSMYSKMLYIHNHTTKCAKSNILLHWCVWIWYFHCRYIFININFDSNSLLSVCQYDMVSDNWKYCKQTGPLYKVWSQKL